MTSISEMDFDHKINGREFVPFRVNMERDCNGLIEKYCAGCGKKIVVYDDRVDLCRICYLDEVI